MFEEASERASEQVPPERASEQVPPERASEQVPPELALVAALVAVQTHAVGYRNHHKEQA
jgi:hypothetical protein